MSLSAARFLPISSCCWPRAILWAVAGVWCVCWGGWSWCWCCWSGGIGGWLAGFATTSWWCWLTGPWIEFKLAADTTLFSIGQDDWAEDGGTMLPPPPPPATTTLPRAAAWMDFLFIHRDLTRDFSGVRQQEKPSDSLWSGFRGLHYFTIAFM